MRGVEKLGHLYDYTVDVSTKELNGLYVSDLYKTVDVDAFLGTEATISIAFEGNGTWALGGGVNIGADAREITGLITEVRCLSVDDRRGFYRLRLRPWLYLTALTRNSRIWQNLSVLEITANVLQPYPFLVEYRLKGPNNKPYPKRDYQRQFWETDYAYLDRLWQEWGISYFMDGRTLVLCDNPTSFKRHGPAYATVIYRERRGQRIDEEHIHELKVPRALTTGRVMLNDYDYTRSQTRIDVTQHWYSESSFDNAEEYAWGDYTQPLAGAMGLEGKPNDWKTEGDILARIKVEAHRGKSLRIKGKGNLRGLTTGYVFTLTDYPLSPGDGHYLVTGIKLDIQNVDIDSQSGSAGAIYQCRIRFTAQPADQFYRTPQKAKKPRAHSEKAIVTAPDQTQIWTDAYGRVKAKFGWDRQGYPNQDSSCWLRVMRPWQGADYGAIWIPREGDEIEVEYQDGDPDKPYVTGSQTNQWHQPAWKLPKNEVLSGWRSQDASRQTLAGNSVVTDDTPGQLQAQITSDHAQSRLVLGFNTHINGYEGRGTARGEGFELATQAWGVVRANRGLLITAEPRSGASSQAMDRGETTQRLEQADQQHDTLAAMAVQGEAFDADDQRSVSENLKQQTKEIGDTGKDGLAGPSKPHLVMASSAGLSATVAGTTHLHSQEHTAITSGGHTSLSVGKKLLASANDAIRMFAYRLGVKLVSYADDIDITALKKNLHLVAKLEITEQANRITIEATDEVLLHGGDSYIRLTPGDITLGAEVFEVNAVHYNTAPDTMTPVTLDLSEVVPPIPTEAPNAALQALIDAANDPRSLWQKTKDMASGAWDATKRMADAAWDDKSEFFWGVLKGIGNLPTDMANLYLLMQKQQLGITQMAQLMDMAAMKAYEGGDIVTANTLAGTAKQMREKGQVGDLFDIKNDAQRAGSIASILVPVGTLAKGAATLAKTAKGARVLAQESALAASVRRPWKTFADNAVFTTRTEWSATRPRGTNQTYSVIQRNDIDWGLVRKNGPGDFVGKTNAEAASKGFAPELSDGSFATLHHIGQDSRGALIEASTRYHGVGKPGQDALHSLYGKNAPHPFYPIDRRAFSVDTREYWQWRGKNLSN
ncbi:MAG: type VI secretion system tip protein VgrG [Burkholderiaceae bacterium]|nr:type VI secretion system tip protein VgrG [Burkholderiaceae bacterium]